MIPDEILKERGYSKSRGGSHNHSDALFQKRVREGEMTLYFINVWQYYRRGDYPGGSTVEVNMYPAEDPGSPWITLTINGSGDVDYVESFARNGYEKLGMVPDPHNQ